MFRFGRTAANRFSHRISTSHNRLTKSQRFVLTKLEERTVPAQIHIVADNSDNGADSLRQILAGTGSKGALVAGDTIQFNTTFFASSQTISLTTGQLPAISL